MVSVAAGADEPVNTRIRGNGPVSDRWRLVLHIPCGIANALMFGICEPAGVVFSVGFMLYEVAQDLHHGDRCYPDLAGWLWGLAGSVIGLYALGAAALFTC